MNTISAVIQYPSYRVRFLASPITLLTIWAACALSFLSIRSHAAEPPKSDPRYPFRTDFANANLPWYMPKPGEFPPHHSDRRISGELVSADFIHRTGQFRTSKNGELVHFTMPPYGSVNYLNSDADLRDVPLGTYFLFFLNQDSHGGFTRMATMQDQFTMDAGHGFNYRLDEIKRADGKLLTTKHKIAKDSPDLEKKELFFTSHTRVWKDGKLATLGDLAVGDELLYNLTGKTATNPGRCSDIWIGATAHKLATEQQRKNFANLLKSRGLPGWIDQIQGNKLSVTLFTGDPNSFKETWLGEFAVGKEIKCCVANDELRTWNPPVDNERGALLEVQKSGVGAYGTSGVRLVFTVSNLLEGFRKGRVVRIFGPGWKLTDPPYAQGLMNYGYSNLKDPELVENVAKEYPTQFPFRTDYGNEDLSWYQLRAGVAPPRFSEHAMLGELLKVDAAKRTGQFRAERTGEVVDFSMIPEATVMHLNADADLSDLPIGGRCHFSMYQDEKGVFTRASLVTDEFSYLARISVNYRIDAIKLDEGKLYVAREIPEVKNYNGDMVQPPDIGRGELLVNADTRVWKGAQQIKLTELATGDILLLNVTSEQAGAPSHCTDIWVGTEAQEIATSGQHKKHQPAKK